ncbi:MAG: hypothetical protein JWM80_1828, partial [Cyanobacteria bacterium RYN_339]|nr:hypothetical protein [Cyanobacteria bacterium RYN_339]
MGAMTARGARPPVLFDQATAPMGQDASGRYYQVRLADDPTAARVLKRFDHPGWRNVATRPLLSQQLWRLVRLARPELPGLALEDLQSDGTTEGVPPYACVLDAPPARVLSERLPLGAEEAGHLVARLLETLWAAHQARVTGLRFEAASVSWDGTGPWRWMAPDLVPPSGTYEGACRDDVLALARFARTLVADLPAESPLTAVINTLTATDSTPAAAMQQAFVRLGHELPLPTMPASSPLMGAEAELETLGAWLRKCAHERRLHTVWLQGDPGSLQWDVCEALAAQARPANMRVAIARCQAEHTPESFLAEVVGQLEAMRANEPELTVPGPSAPPPDLPPALARLRQLRTFRALLADVAEQTPLCLAWLGYEGADGLIQELVAHLTQHSDGLPVLLVLGADADAPEGAAAPNSEDEVLLLRPLFRAEVERLARAHCPGLALGLAAIDAAWKFSAGQPSQIYRLCLHWLRNGGLRQDAAGAWVPRDEGPRLVPPEVVREFLRAFATMGPAATLTTMQALMDMPPATFFELLEAALDGGWLRQEHGWLAFWRPDEARALASQMAPAEALRWHRRLAAVAALPAAGRAFHAARGGQDAMAAPFIAEAGRRLLLHGALEAAARLFRLGLEVGTEDDGHRLDLLEGLALERLESKEPAQALALLVAELGRPAGMTESALGRLAMLQGRARALLGDLPGARSAYERALP